MTRSLRDWLPDRRRMLVMPKPQMRGSLVAGALVLSCLWLAAALEATAGTLQEAPGQQGPPAAPRTAPRLPVRWWNDAALAARVGLTPEQIDRINGIFEEYLPPQRERWKAFRPLETELNDLLAQPHPDEGRVVDLITRVENRRSELTRQRLIMLFHIHQVLTPSQRAQLRLLESPTEPVKSPGVPK